jgi:hypothetical protein
MLLVVQGNDKANGCYHWTGENWYAYGKGVAMTINAHCNTIITAHKINAKVRTMEKSDHAYLNEFCINQFLFRMERTFRQKVSSMILRYSFTSKISGARLGIWCSCRAK